MNNPIQYFVLNGTLKMTKGKLCSQVAHATTVVIEDILQFYYESKIATKEYNTYLKWKQEGCAKIVLVGTTTQLKELSKLPNAFPIYDAGKTQVDTGSLTCVGFYPSSNMKDVLEGYKLL